MNPQLCTRSNCKRPGAACIHTETGLPFCTACARQINFHNPGLVRIPEDHPIPMRDPIPTGNQYIIYGCASEKCGYRLLPTNLGTRYTRCPNCGSSWTANPPPIQSIDPQKKKKKGAK